MYVNESYGGARLKVSIDGKWYNLDVYLMDPSTKDSSGQACYNIWSDNYMLLHQKTENIASDNLIKPVRKNPL